MSASLTYVFCIVRSPEPPSLRGVPSGMPGGGPVRLIELLIPRAGRTRHWLAVSTVPARRYGEAALERGLQRLAWVSRHALAHEAVVEHFLSARALLPMKLFTLFTSDERAVDHVRRDRTRVFKLLSRLDRHVEWGLRAVWDPTQDAAPQARPVPARGRGRAGTGTSYLARKRDEQDRSRVLVRRARADADRLYRAVARVATAAVRRTDLDGAPGSRLLLDAAFLVPSGGAGRFQSLVRRSASALETSQIAVSVTGPWPAYNFL